MFFTSSLEAVLDSTVGRARSWPVQSQQGARRNAMIACTALAARRAERENVEDFFAALSSPAAAAPRPASAAHG